MREKIRKNWVSIFIGVIIVVLVVSAVLRALAPARVVVTQSPQYTQSNFYDTTTTFQNISFSGTPIDVPQQMTVARTTTVANISTVLARLETDFQLVPMSNLTDIWQGPSYSLAKSSDINQYILNLNDSDLATHSGSLNKDTSIATAQVILQKYAPDAAVSVVDSAIGYYPAGPETSKTSIDKADWISLPFSYIIDGYPVLYRTQSDVPFDLLLDSSGTLIKFTFYPLYLQVTALPKQNTISIEQAVKNINLGQASLVGSDSQDPDGSNISLIKSANLESVSLEYRIDDKTMLAYPFYHFEGTAVNVNNVPITVKIITPAIQTVTQ